MAEEVKRRQARVVLKRYYSSYIGTLVAADGRQYCLGELPKFLERALGVPWHDFSTEVVDLGAADPVRGPYILARVLLRHMREHIGATRNYQVYATLDSMQPWDYYA